MTAPPAVHRVRRGGAELLDDVLVADHYQRVRVAELVHDDPPLDPIEQPGDERELLDAARWSALSTTQDVIAESTGEPWPGRSTELPLPDVEVLDTEIRLCTGSAMRRLSPSIRSFGDVEDEVDDPSRGAVRCELTAGDVPGNHLV